MNSRFTDRRHGHFFWYSIQDSIYLHVREPNSFSLEKWYVFWTNAQLGPEERADLKQAMEEAHAAWLDRNTPEYLLSHGSTNLRSVATRSERRRDLFRMNDQQVAQALHEDVAEGWLVFVPNHEEMRKCVLAIREERDRTPRSSPARTPQLTNADMAKLLYGNSPRMPQDLNTPLGGAQPFEYTPEAVSGEAEELAASTNNPNYAAKMLGYDRKTFGDMIHTMKDGLDLGGADNVIWHDNGDIEFDGNIIGNMYDY
jgi:hypothetical protein